ncbi:hypothetical protein L1887_61874 [Cichorium endivia]|nr:hypothetical protein L1887_61874 [Cichorium endivia]
MPATPPMPGYDAVAVPVLDSTLGNTDIMTRISLTFPTQLSLARLQDSWYELVRAWPILAARVRHTPSTPSGLSFLIPQPDKVKELEQRSRTSHKDQEKHIVIVDASSRSIASFHPITAKAIQSSLSRDTVSVGAAPDNADSLKMTCSNATDVAEASCSARIRRTSPRTRPSGATPPPSRSHSAISPETPSASSRSLRRGDRLSSRPHLRHYRVSASTLSSPTSSARQEQQVRRHRQAGRARCGFATGFLPVWIHRQGAARLELDFGHQDQAAREEVWPVLHVHARGESAGTHGASACRCRCARVGVGRQREAGARYADQHVQRAACVAAAEHPRGESETQAHEHRHDHCECQDATACSTRSLRLSSTPAMGREHWIDPANMQANIVTLLRHTRLGQAYGKTDLLCTPQPLPLRLHRMAFDALWRAGFRRGCFAPFERQGRWRSGRIWRSPCRSAIAG